MPRYSLTSNSLSSAVCQWILKSGHRQRGICHNIGIKFGNKEQELELKSGGRVTLENISPSGMYGNIRELWISPGYEVEI